MGLLIDKCVMTELRTASSMLGGRVFSGYYDRARQGPHRDLLGPVYAEAEDCVVLVSGTVGQGYLPFQGSRKIGEGCCDQGLDGIHVQEDRGAL